MIELIFSFVLNSWAGLGMVHTWSEGNFGERQIFIERLSADQEILCALEVQGDLVYDGRWREKSLLVVPKKCLKGLSAAEKKIPKISLRSLTLASVPNLSSWDHQIDVRLEGAAPFTVYLRQDKQYIGVHSTAGWAMWVERKKGSIRYEMVDAKNERHFRLKVRGNINPLKGDWESIHHLEALHAQHNKGLIQKAHILVGKADEGFAEVIFEREPMGLKRLNKADAKKGTPASFVDSWAFKVGEKELALFCDVANQNYVDFIQRGRPLAFTSVNPEHTVPETALFR